MFTNALKSFTSNITSNYILSPAPVAHSGPWKIHDAKKKKTNQSVSVWIFERKSLDSGGGSSNGLSLRGGGSSRDGLKAAQDEVVERLKKEASLLARLRHPCVLELVEPVEDTRGGGLMFATEAVLSSLSTLLQEKDEEEGRSNGRYGRDSANGRRRGEVEIDELEIQKGLLQIGKALEFLHESAALVHGNITPEAVMVNAKSDWKLTSLSFTISSTNPPLPPAFDARLPPHVQLSLDYASPDLVLDNTLTPSTDLFSLGLLIVALYNHPHRSPLETHNSTSTYRRLLTTASTTPNVSNNFLSSRPLPRPLVDSLLPHLLTRRPAGRLTAREFQQNEYFDNILVSALRFLDSLPAKTPSEKSAFMRGLPKVLPQFPRSVLEKKILPGLVEELRDGSMLALVLPNVFAIAEVGSARLFSEKVLGKLKEVFLPTPNASSTPASEPKTAAAKIAEREKEAGKEGGLTVVITNLAIIMEKTTSREFKEDILPVYQLALESPTHALQDLALRSLAVILPKLDFPTLKNDLFPIVASVFTKTSSLGIKIRGLEAFKVLCGGTPPVNTDGLDGFDKIAKQRAGDCPVLDKYTIQEKVVPLLKGIKTKEPAVMMAALDVFSEIGKVCDREIVAMELLPGLWTMSFGPLLGLEQFQAFMATIKSLSSKIEHEQTRKLQELSSSGSGAINAGNGAGEFLSFGGIPGANNRPLSTGDSDAFADLVFGKSKPGNGASSPGLSNGGWGGGSSSSGVGASLGAGSGAAVQKKPETPAFSWSTPAPTQSPAVAPMGTLALQQQRSQQPSRTVTPDARFAPLTPSTPSSTTSNMGMGMGMNLGLQPLQPSPGFGSTTALRPQPSPTQQPQPQPQSTAGTAGGMSIDWSSAVGSRKPSFNTAPLTPKPATPNTYGNQNMGMNQNRSNGFAPPPPQQTQTQASHPTILYGQTRQQAAPTQGTGAFAGFMIPPPPGSGGSMNGGGMSGGMNLVIGSGAIGMKKVEEKKGLDAWESLL